MALARRMAGFTESPTLRVSTIARTLRAQGRDVVDFGSGEPDFDTPEHIKQAAVKALREGFTKYTTPSGIDELKDAIVDKLKRDNGLLYRREQVVVSCGAKHTLHNLAQVLFDPGDEVILPALTGRRMRRLSKWPRPCQSSFPPLSTKASASPSTRWSVT